MKLKYYLRGLGMGIMFATIVMTVSSNIHNNNLSEEKIIEEAKKLGMIMPDESEDKNGLWGDSKDDTEGDTVDENSEDTQKPADSEKPQDTQSSSDSEKPQDNQPPAESQSSQDTQISENTQDSSESEEPTYIKITIKPNDSATAIVKTLYRNGLIDSEDDFHDYLSKKGYTRIIRAGVFEIPLGATYEEICAIIIYAANND